MKVLLIGDTSGNLDEGMKKVSFRLKEYLNEFNSCETYFVSLIDILKNRKEYKDADIVNFMVGPSWRTFIYGFLLKLILNRKVIVVISFIHPKWTWLSKLSFLIFKPNAAIIQTQKWKEITQKHIEKVTDIPLAGINRKKFFPVNENEKRQLKKKLGMPLNKTILIHVGHLNEGRNLKVLNQLKNSKKIFPIVIASSTVSTDKELLNSLKENDVKVIKGFIPRIDEYYKAADCYVFPTVDSNFAIQIPLSVIEALACNLPVIATRYEALPFYFPENRPSLTYINNFDNLEQDIFNVINTKKEKIKYEEELIRVFDWHIISERLFVFYKELIRVC